MVVCVVSQTGGPSISHVEQGRDDRRDHLQHVAPAVGVLGVARARHLGGAEERGPSGIAERRPGGRVELVDRRDQLAVVAVDHSVRLAVEVPLGVLELSVADAEVVVVGAERDGAGQHLHLHLALHRAARLGPGGHDRVVGVDADGLDAREIAADLHVAAVDGAVPARRDVTGRALQVHDQDLRVEALLEHALDAADRVGGHQRVVGAADRPVDAEDRQHGHRLARRVVDADHEEVMVLLRPADEHVVLGATVVADGILRIEVPVVGESDLRRLHGVDGLLRHRGQLLDQRVVDVGAPDAEADREPRVAGVVAERRVAVAAGDDDLARERWTERGLDVVDEALIRAGEVRLQEDDGLVAGPEGERPHAGDGDDARRRRERARDARVTHVTRVGDVAVAAISLRAGGVRGQRRADGDVEKGLGGPRRHRARGHRAPGAAGGRRLLELAVIQRRNRRGARVLGTGVRRTRIGRGVARHAGAAAAHEREHHRAQESSCSAPSVPRVVGRAPLFRAPEWRRECGVRA